MKYYKYDDHYMRTVVDFFKQKFSINDLMVPKIQKINVSISAKDAISDSKVIKKIFEDLFLITGQKPVITKAKKSIAAFKLRQGMLIGVKCTLRKRIMYDFLTKLVNIALPRIRDFRGFNSRQLDGNGNFSFGIKEQIIFPEIDYNKIDKIRGIGIVIVTSTTSDTRAKILLEKLGLPFLN